MRQKNLVLIFCLLFGLTTAYAQQRVGGIVTDNQNEPIPGLTVMEKGTVNGVITDVNGRYSLEVANGNSVLVFSYVGMQTQEVGVGSRASIDVVMAENPTDLEDLVVIGYGVQRRALVTGANNNVRGEQIAELKTSTAMEALQGVTPGVQVTRNSGEPGAGTKVTIRGLGTVGDATPLYIVDGVSVGNINYLNPSDIDNRRTERRRFCCHLRFACCKRCNPRNYQKRENGCKTKNYLRWLLWTTKPLQKTCRIERTGIHVPI